MDNIELEFNKRKTEIIKYYEYVKEIIKFQEINDVHMILKSNYYLLLYNLIEATLNSCYVKIGNILSQYYYKDINDTLKDTFISYNSCAIKKLDDNKAKNRMLFFEEIFKGKRTLPQDFIGFVNGNVNLDKFKEFAKKLGLDLSEELNKKCYIYFETILMTRDNLAHGSVSFVDLGRTKTISDLESANNIFDYLSDFIERFKLYLIKEVFLSKD